MRRRRTGAIPFSRRDFGNARISSLSSHILGEWTLDLKRSQSIGPVLELLGVGWLGRKTADNLSQTLVIRQEFPELVITYKTMMGSTTDELRFGEETSIVTSDRRVQKVRYLILSYE